MCRFVCFLALAVACKGTPDDTDLPTPTGPPPIDCTTLPDSFPIEPVTLEGFTGSEDFAFDDRGRMVSVDENGNLLAITRDGETSVLAAGFGDTAGIRYLPGGDLVLANVSSGSLDRIAPSGGVVTVLSGLNYPNGVEVDLEGMVYVAEQETGQIRQIDPDSGAFTVLATGLFNPNGLTFNLDYTKLYVGSFGGGTVHVLERDGNGFSQPVLFGQVEGVEPPPDPCNLQVEGDSCFVLSPYGGVGTCQPRGELLTCLPLFDEAACAGLDAGTACTATYLGESIESTCQLGAAPGLFCPLAGNARITACAGGSEDCSLNGQPGYCFPTWEGVVACSVEDDWLQADEMCTDAPEGSPCQSNSTTIPFEGTCVDQLGYRYCLPALGFGESGGLDGVNVDACDNLYVTEYIQGTVWRFPPTGGSPEVAVQTDSQWIPNMHWGRGSGFSETAMYISDRDSQALFEVELGIGGKPIAAPAGQP